jgi:membrane fusion protein, copper/silver efflux system
MKLNKKEIIIAAGGLLAGLLIFFIINQITASESVRTGEDIVEHTEHEQIWTCSMHPQIRQNEPGDCPLCGMDLIPVTTGTGNGEINPFVHTMSPEAEALANIQTVKVGYTSPEYEVYLTGKIAADEKKLAVITANYSGRIEKLFVDFTGQSVKKGEKMATIYSPELITAQKELIEAAKNKEINPSLYNAVREKLRLWRITEGQIEAIESGGKIMSELDVYSDITGVIINRNVSTGDYVNRGSVLFEAAELSSIWIILDAYENDLAWIKTGSKINFTVASIPGKEFSSTITFVDPLINPQTRTVSVRAEANNPGMILKPEMFVKATIKVQSNISKGNSERDKSLVVPKTSVLWTGTRSVVYVKVPGSEFPAYEMREVDLGSRAGDFYIIEDGLQEGEEIVTNGVFAIDAAAQLSGNYSMMNRPVSKRITVPEEFKSQLTTVAENYFDLKNALVNDDYKNAKTAADKVLKSLKSVSMNLLNEKADHAWMEFEKNLRESSGMISKAKNIEMQRVHFEKLSDAIIETADSFGLKINMVYVQFCPMAFDDKGAYWLSEAPEILNPYFGDEMLTCGEVTKKISSLDSYQEAGDEAQQPIEHQH